MKKISIIISIIIFIFISLLQLYFYRSDGGVSILGYLEEDDIHNAFFVRGKSIENISLDFDEKFFYWRAMKKYRSLNSCLLQKPDNNYKNISLKWKSIRNGYEFEICLHYISLHLKKPPLIRDWLISEGFEAVHYDKNFSSFSVDSVVAFWNPEINGRYSPFSALSTFSLGEYNPLVTGPIYLRMEFNSENHLINQSHNFVTF